MNIQVQLAPYFFGGTLIVGAAAFLFFAAQMNRIEGVLNAVAAKILGEQVP